MIIRDENSEECRGGSCGPTGRIPVRSRGPVRETDWRLGTSEAMRYASFGRDDGGGPPERRGENEGA